MKKPSIHGWMNAWAVVPLQVKESKVYSSMTATVSFICLQNVLGRHNVFWLLNQAEVAGVCVWVFPQEKI